MHNNIDSISMTKWKLSKFRGECEIEEEAKATAYELEIKTILKRNNILYIHCIFIVHLFFELIIYTIMNKIFLKTILNGINQKLKKENGD